MAVSKIELFTEEHARLAGFAGALAHPARIAIIKYLQECGEASSGMIGEAIPLAQTTVSQHIATLRKAGLLLHRTCGKKTCYQVNCDEVLRFCHSFQCTLGTVGESRPVISSTCTSDDPQSD